VWQNQPETGLNYTKEDIHNMVKKKSTSIVKWILIISIIELLLPYVLFLFTDLKTEDQIYADYGLENLRRNYTIIYVIIILGFIYLFYRNYRNISADSSVKSLLRDILKTRKTVKYYIYFNLILFGVVGIHLLYASIQSEAFVENTLPENANITVLWVSAILALGLTILVLWFFYRLVYGFFLKKLQRNYKELRKME
jgi:hypothetical protein